MVKNNKKENLTITDAAKIIQEVGFVLIMITKV